MACGYAIVSGSEQGETRTANDAGLTKGFRIATLLTRLHYLALGPWVILSIPSRALFELQGLAVLAVSGIGFSGMLLKRGALAKAASLSLLALVIGGKVGEDLLGAAAPDTAVLLIQFVVVIFLMEASRVVLVFDLENGQLAGKDDDLSMDIFRRLVNWAKGQLVSQARIMLSVLGLSLVLLVVGGLTSVSINQLGFSAGLVLVAVGVLLFLITQRREPETR